MILDKRLCQLCLCLFGMVISQIAIAVEGTDRQDLPGRSTIRTIRPVHEPR